MNLIMSWSQCEKIWYFSEKLTWCQQLSFHDSCWTWSFQCEEKHRKLNYNRSQKWTCLWLISSLSYHLSESSYHASRHSQLSMSWFQLIWLSACKDESASRHENVWWTLSLIFDHQMSIWRSQLLSTTIVLTRRFIICLSINSSYRLNFY